jgi:NADH-quinone oxidoreductase subunit H
MKFALFFLAEYINMVTVSALATTLFLGGWRAPWPISLWESANTGYWPLLWWLAKIQIFIFMFIWLRATLPRLRYDQFMKFGWKILIPVSIAWIMIVATARVLRNEVEFTSTQILLVGGITIVILLLGSWLLQSRADRKSALQEEIDAEVQGRVFDAMAGGYPVPPMPDQQVSLPTRRATSSVTTQEAIDG